MPGRPWCILHLTLQTSTNVYTATASARRVGRTGVRLVLVGAQVAQAVAAQLDVQALARQARASRAAEARLSRVSSSAASMHSCSIRSVVSRDDVLQRHAADQFGQLLDRARHGQRGRRAARACRRRPTSRTAKASTVSSPTSSTAAEISTSALPPYSPRSVVDEQAAPAALAQVGDQHAEVDAGAAEPAVQRLAAHLLLGAELGQRDEGAVGRQHAAVGVGEHQAVGRIAQ